MNVVQWAVNNWPKDISRTGLDWSGVGDGEESERRQNKRGASVKDMKVEGIKSDMD